MPIDVTIFRQHGLVYVKYRGDISTRDSLRAYSEYLNDPDFSPTQHRLFDLTGVGSYTPDPVASLRLHAKMIEQVMPLKHPIMMVYLAPTQAARELCRGRIESWKPVDNAIASLVDSEGAALGILGLRVGNIQALCAKTP